MLVACNFLWKRDFSTRALAMQWMADDTKSVDGTSPWQDARPESSPQHVIFKIGKMFGISSLLDMTLDQVQCMT